MLIGRVVGGEDGQDGVHGAEHGLVHGVHGVDEHVHARGLAGAAPGRIEVLVEEGDVRDAPDGVKNEIKPTLGGWAWPRDSRNKT
jgi:hypothetical protein